ncbi:glycosyltransferase [Tateyamaria sp. syn59]|uniref:glycosyltransferase n=1 Tax=Tateyamaria sp. syn59 TaxID=2576942 RepID=UPI0011BF7DEC|nr:glycosyltransferase [Tateyamaria sp. syn59]
MTKSGKLLIYAPVPLVETDAGLHLESQACNGLRLWAEHFDEVVCMNPLASGALPDGWVPISDTDLDMARIRLVPLPMAYRPDQFLRHYRACRDVIRDEIAKADYLSFAIGGLTGDWGSVAAWQAHRAGLPFAVWTDRVESEVVRRTASSSDLWRRRVRARLEHRLMWWWEKFIIRRATLGLFHGKETFDTYAPYCGQPRLVHDIHLNKADHIAQDQVQAKVAGVADGPLNIVYTGRASAMKGPQDWVGVLDRLNAQGVDFQATWLGDGPDLAEMKALVAAAGIEAKVHFAGFVDDRATVLRHLRDAHVFLFCHKTPESPRCLIEALVSATPIVGYDGSYPRDLIAVHQGGRLVPLDDVAALAEAVVALDQDRAALADLIKRAARDGEPFDEDSVFEHRSEIIKACL